MAEVLSPPLQPSTISLLHSRPSSSDAFSASQQQYPQPHRLGQAPRGMYNGQNNSYRGATAPVQPYAFQSTPTLRQDMRTTSAPTTSHGPIGGHRTTASVSTSSSSDTSSQAKDDSVIGGRPASFLNLSSIPDLSLSLDQPVKASPDRYRRPGQKRTDSTASGPRAASPQLGTPAVAAVAPTNVAQQPQPVARQSSVDDMALSKSGQSDLAKSRYRRRSLNQLETQNLAIPPAQAGAGAQRPSSGHGQSATSTPTTIRPVSFHPQEGDRQGQPDKKVSAESAKVAAVSKPEQKLAVPARGSSSDVNKRLAAPSPLSRNASDVDSQAPSVTASPTKPRTYAAVAQAAVHSPSPAAAQLAAVSDRDLNKGMKSRLRRAFSFGSAQELRRAAGENNQAQSHQAQSRQAQQTQQQHRQQIDDEMDAEQMEIARRQEAAGIGAGIYSGQGGFTGSTDNLSISSTASSASMMLRKMGRGAKKSARSVKSLFRPKSVIGVPAADGPLESTVGPVAQVSMVTVEAERQNVNVNAHPGELADGSTGYPKLERNSMDAMSSATTAVEKQRGSADGSDSRRSVVGSDKDRAEVLAAVKKGILKRSGTSSPGGSPVVKPIDGNFNANPQITESPVSSMPSTPREAPQGRSVSTPVPNGDYFATRVTVTKSMPNTPNGSSRNISFSPRIQFHDVWSSTEYDRRGEVATCNRLTPMLAQQIKEELNTFKMEMEVHEASKPHTHFF